MFNIPYTKTIPPITFQFFQINCQDLLVSFQALTILTGFFGRFFICSALYFLGRNWRGLCGLGATAMVVGFLAATFPADTVVLEVAAFDRLPPAVGFFRVFFTPGITNVYCSIPKFSVLGVRFHLL